MKEKVEGYYARNGPYEWFKRTFAGGALVVGSLIMPATLEEAMFEPKYPLHKEIVATVFWVGEGPSADNNYIHNRSSAWTKDWVKSYGGVDNPNDRCGYRPCEFTPKENPFYVALPFSDHNKKGLKQNLERVPWYKQPLNEDESILKNRWVKITKNKISVYAQWEDVGPFRSNDADYVFSNEKPRDDRAGIDLSPATADYLGIGGKSKVSWRFVDEENVPDGPWKEIVTNTDPSF